MIEARGGGALVELSGRRDAAYGVTSSFQAKNDYLDHVRWGAADNQPNTIAHVIERNNQVRGQLDTLRDMLYGTGLGFFKRVIENGKVSLVPFTDDRLEEWADATNLQAYAIASINQFVQNANSFTRLVYDPVNTWHELEVSDCFVTRIGKPGQYGVFEYHTNPYFGEGTFFDKNATEKIPVFDPKALPGEQAIVTMYHGKADMPGNPFYSYPSWWCAIDWIELANLIPLFHKSGLKNGYNIKYLIKMPQDYFNKEGERTLDAKEVKSKWSNWGNNLSSWMSGTNNVNKSMIIKYLRGQDGKMLDNIDVIPMKNEMSDDAYSKVWEMSNVSISNAMGLMPTLSGVNPGKGNDSGSQIRVMADYQQHFRTAVPRHVITKPILLALRAMGYKDVVPAFKDVQITTLDANPNGVAATVNHGAA